MSIFYFICELGYHACTLDAKNSTKEDYNQDVSGIRRAAQLPNNIFLNPNQQCFTQFFVHGQPPTGLRVATLNNMRYICQLRAPSQSIRYASMHDEGLGIPVYSAYVLHANNVNFQAQAAATWIRTPGKVFTCTKKKKQRKKHKRVTSKRLSFHIALICKVRLYKLYLTYLISPLTLYNAPKSCLATSYTENENGA